MVDDDIRQLIMQNVASSTIKKMAISKGMITLREDGRLKVMAGITSIDEVLRTTQDDMDDIERAEPLPAYEYKALNKAGKEVSSVRDAESEKSLRTLLKKEESLRHPS